MKKYLLMFLVSFVALVSCKETIIQVQAEKDPVLKLCVDKSELIASSSETLVVAYTLEGVISEAQLRVICQKGWTATVNSSSMNAGTIELTAPENVEEVSLVAVAEEDDDRSSFVEIHVKPSYCYPAVSNLDFSQEAGMQTVGISSNVSYEVIIPENDREWLSSEQDVTGGLSIRVLENRSYPRTSVIRLSSAAGSSDMEIYQSGIFPQTASDNQIIYTTNDSEPLALSPDFESNMRVKVISHEYFPKENVGVIEFDRPVTHIGDLAFFNCTNLTGIMMPGIVAEIGYRAFFSCSALTGINLHEGIESIQDEAYDSCSGVTTVTIPSTVKYLGIGAFFNIPLKTIYCKPVNVPEMYSILCERGVKVYVPAQSLENYKTAEYWRWNSRDMEGMEF